MILVILGVCIAMIVVGVVIYEHSCVDAWECVAIVFAILAFVALVAAIVLGSIVSIDGRIDEKIAMYTEENAKIEQQIADCVERYQEYEQGIFEKVSPDDAVTLVSFYPELKSDTLVKEQIETYVSNNNKIKELKEQQIDASVRKWWLYFGG